MNTENNNVSGFEFDNPVEVIEDEDSIQFPQLTAQEQDLKKQLEGEFFREEYDGTWTNKKGWTVQLEEDDSDWDRSYCLYKNGEKLYETLSFWTLKSLFNLKTQTYYERKGREANGYMDMRLGNIHFGPGTVFKTKDHIAKDFPQYEIDHLVCNGARSFVAITKEVHPEGYFKGSPYSIHLSHVVKIIKPGKGEVKYASREKEDNVAKEVLDFEFLRLPYLQFECIGERVRFKKGELLTDSPTALFSRGFAPELFSNKDNIGKHYSEEKMEKHLLALGYIRICNFEVEGYPFRALIVKMKKTRKWLKKNAHRVLCNLDTSYKTEKKQEQEDYEMYCNDIDDNF